MPTSQEVVRQKMLNGKELKEVLLNRLQESLAMDPMFQEHLAYGRLDWTVQITLKMDNMNYKEHKVQSKGREGDGEIGAGAETQEFKIEDGFTSPNAARVQNGLPVPIDVRQGGRTEEKGIQYDKNSAPKAPVAPVQNLTPKLPQINPALGGVNAPKR